jgi:four helix bundle protein
MNNHLFTLEKLQVWQDAIKLTQLVYTITSKFPPQEQYVLTSQIRRATISIASNIAEGSGRFSAKDQAHFYQMA